MARRGKKTPSDAFLEIVPAVGGLLLLSYLFVPRFKQKLEVAAVFLAWLAGGALLIGLGVFLWRRMDRPDEMESLLEKSRARPNSTEPLQPAPIPERGRPQWSLELLRSLDWKRYEDVVASFAKHVGHVGETTRIGADGGIDVHVYEPGNPRPVMIVQCKAWETYKVGVKPLRELFGVMAAEQVKEGAFFTTSDFTAEALDFARGKALDLVNGAEFLARIRQLPPSAQNDLLEFATLGDYTTPTCPSCGTKMLVRTATKGANAGSTFWGCRNYPRCKRTFQSKSP